MNIAYKHLDAKLRIAELSIGQWIGVLLGLAIGIAWGVYISPFPPTITLMSSIYVASLPAGAAFLGNVTEFSPWLILRSAVAWRRLDGRFPPGPGASARGYVVTGEDPVDRSGRWRGPAELDFASLWEEAR